MTKNELIDLTYANNTSGIGHDMDFFVRVQKQTPEQANETLVRTLIKAFPGLRRKLTEFWKSGYRMSTQERNSILIKALFTLFREYQRLESENKRLQKQIDGSRQTDILDYLV
jgi:hypothetical protein